MPKSTWNTKRRDATVAVSDGTATYYARYDFDYSTLAHAAEDFAACYDHNDIEGDVQCEARRLDNGEILKFTCQ